MQKYYHTLNNKEKEKIKAIYQKEYANSDLKVRLLRLKIYSALSYIVALTILISLFFYDDSKISSIIISICLILLGTTYLVSSIMIKNNILNKLALKNKK